MLTLVSSGPAVAATQAPSAATMWRLTGSALGSPRAVFDGATAWFWNPAFLGANPGFVVGIDVLQTPRAIALESQIVAVSKRIAPSTFLGVQYGRVEVDDLTRTTTSPFAEAGSIPVYEQLVGVGFGFEHDLGYLGLSLRGHDARFDTFDDAGTTLDLGVLLTPTDKFRIGVATHFFPITFTSHHVTDLMAGIEYDVVSSSVFGIPGTLSARYGLQYHDPGGVDHGVGIGWSIASLLTLDALLARERGATEAAWRPTVEMGLQVGRYAIQVARSEGVNDLGASYRFSLAIELGS